MEKVYIYALATTVGGLGFLLAWIYFDRTRQKDPYYRKKMKLKREYERKLTELEKTRTATNLTQSRKEEDIIILHELQIGEALMLKGHLEEATQHFSNAVAVCSNPEKFLRTLRNCLDPNVYHMLLNLLIKGNMTTYSKLHLCDAFETSMK